MKQSIYQKLLMSLAMVAFFGTLVSAQVLTRNQLERKHTSQKVQPVQKYTDAELAEKRAERMRLKESEAKRENKVKPTKQLQTFKPVQTNKKRKVVKQNTVAPQQNKELKAQYTGDKLKQRAAQINEKLKAEGKGQKAVITKPINGKRYIQIIEPPLNIGMPGKKLNQN